MVSLHRTSSQKPERWWNLNPIGQLAVEWGPVGARRRQNPAPHSTQPTPPVKGSTNRPQQQEEDAELHPSQGKDKEDLPEYGLGEVGQVEGRAYILAL